MKKKKSATTGKTISSPKPAYFCNHCGGALRFFQDEVSCLMCGRNANHFCKNCLSDPNLIKKSA